uniref:Uncharacterized protein n=1 Tax=Romanomermis culicivorax TaxID=13658 RepID=A0A915JTS6_ROMCU
MPEAEKNCFRLPHVLLTYRRLNIFGELIINVPNNHTVHAINDNFERIKFVLHAEPMTEQRYMSENLVIHNFENVRKLEYCSRKHKDLTTAELTIKRYLLIPYD